MKKLFFDKKMLKVTQTMIYRDLEPLLGLKFCECFIKKKLKNSAKCIKNKFAKNRKINESNKNP